MNTKALYTAEQDAWLLDNWGRLGSDAVEEFNKLFGQHRTYQGIRSRSQKLGARVDKNLKSKRARENAKRHVPIGTIHMAKGYLQIKVADVKGKRTSNWKPYHRYVYEQTYGEIPKGMTIIFLDGDHTNCSIDNLMAVPQAVNALLMTKQLRSANGELTKVGIEWCKLYRMLQEDGYFEREKEREIERKKTERYANLNADQKRAVYKCDTDGNVIAKYDGIAEASRAENLSASHISGCARGKRHTCGGYKWMYTEGE